MSMTVFMILQMIGIFCAYFGVTLILPLVVFRSLLKGKSIINQILFSFLIGNFYIITMVQILQLLKISHTITLILATVVPAYVVWVKLNKVEVAKAATEVGTNVKRVTEKHMGAKTAAYRFIRNLHKKSKKAAGYIWKLISKNWLEILLQLLVFGVLAYLYGQGIISTYGYTASDTPVHNYWINALSDNNIFVAGVYPHAYHCMLYYLHAVFGFKTYVLLSLFAFVQVVCIHFALIYFLKGCCKVSYISYISVILYTLGEFFLYGTYARFVCTLPQEYGMIFILPCIYYGFEFFRVRYDEVKQEKEKKESLFCLFGFAMGFAMTLSAHFYNTIIVGLFCIAIAIGYLFLFVRKQYFGNVVITCVISLVIAILPMGIAFATGTPLQGSLRWATGIIAGEDKEESNNELPETEGTELNIPREDVTKTDKETITDDGNHVATDNADIQNVESSENKNNVSMTERLGKIKQIPKTISSVMKNELWETDMAWCSNVFWGLIILLLLEGVIYLLFRKICYGAMLVSVAIYMIIMSLLLASGRLGIITLMDASRAGIYFAYMCPVLLAMVLDAFIYGLVRDSRFEVLRNVFVIALLGLSVWGLVLGEKIRKPYSATGLETNEAITCVTNILNKEPNFTWTICSANDELRMCEEYGYHYEIITMLRQMRNWDKDKTITIPTPKVYFLIEKRPINYTVTYEGSGQLVSMEGAGRNISNASGIIPYQGENRWITMSHMYYWAQEFQRMYPNEMKVYMETDDFVCYVLEQNTYSLVNLAIDYGYNTGEK